jgi:hypothetical protein
LPDEFPSNDDSSDKRSSIDLSFVEMLESLVDEELAVVAPVVADVLSVVSVLPADEAVVSLLSALASVMLNESPFPSATVVVELPSALVVDVASPSATRLESVVLSAFSVSSLSLVEDDCCGGGGGRSAMPSAELSSLAAVAVAVLPDDKVLLLVELVCRPSNKLRNALSKSVEPIEVYVLA